jgi:hypothetical protein
MTDLQKIRLTFDTVEKVSLDDLMMTVMYQMASLTLLTLAMNDLTGAPLEELGLRTNLELLDFQ